MTGTEGADTQWKISWSRFFTGQDVLHDAPQSNTRNSDYNKKKHINCYKSDTHSLKAEADKCFKL